MSRIQVVKTNMRMPEGAAALAGVKQLLFGALDGFSNDDKRAWRRFWKRLRDLEPGEILAIDAAFPRNGKFHRLHMQLEQTLFDSQERITDFEVFRTYLKIGSGWVNWIAGPKGGVIPVPKSISYAKADDEEFKQYHEKVLAFARSPHFSRYLWPHLTEQQQMEMVSQILDGFE